MNALRLWGRYATVSVLGQMQYPGSFLILAAAQFANTVIGFVGVWILFARFGHIGGWSLGQIALFYGSITIAFAIADALSRGFDVFGPEFVKTGNFDRLLTPAAWSPGAATLLAWSILGGAAIFYGLLIAQATLAFWTVESLEVANIVTYGGVEAGQYPLDIYARWFRNLLMFVVPIGCVGYLPLTLILGKPNVFGAPAWAAVASPLVGWAFLGASLLVWGLGVRRYTSTGS